MALNKKVAIEIEIKNIEKVSKLKDELKKLRKEQKATEDATAEGTKLGKKRAAQYSETATKIKHKSTELRKLNKNLRNSNDTTKKVTKSSNGMAKQFIKGAAAIGIIVTAFRVVSRVVSSVISTFSEFEFVMAKVQAVSGATTEEFKQLEQSAQDLGRTTFFTATQVGELQLNFSKLGFSATEIMQAQEATLNLATATGSDLARSAIVAGAAVRGFGLDASETQRVVDVMAVSFASSALDIEKWQTSMTKVAPIAKSSGFSIEDTAAIMAKLSDSGIEASIAGTSLRNILLKMQDPSSKLTKAFGKTIHGLDDLVPAMRKFVKEGGSMADVMEVVDIRQAGAFEQMLSTTNATLELRDALLEANGEGERMALIVGDTLQGSFLKFKSAIQGLSIAFLDLIAEPFQKMIENTASFFNKLTLLVEGFDSLNEKIFETAKAFKVEEKATEQLVTEYAKLDGIVNKTKEEKLRFNLVTKELEKNIGASIKVIDQETGALIINSKALDAAIARHALLADGEAVKLVSALNKVKKEIDNNNKALGENNNIIQQNQQLLDELTKTEADKIINNKQLGNQQKMLNAEGRVQENTTGKINKLNEEQYELDVKIKNLQQKNIPVLNKNNELALEKANLHKMLNALGYTQADLDALTAKNLKTLTESQQSNTSSIVANTTAKKENALASGFITTQTMAYWNTLMEGVLDGTDTIKDAEQELRDFQIELLTNLLLDEGLAGKERVKLNNQLTQLKLKNAKAVADEEGKINAERIEKLEMGAEVIKGIMNLQQQNDDRRTSRAIKNLEERKESGIISQEQYEKEVEKLERAAFERTKKRQIAEALMNTALGITKAFPKWWEMALVAAMGLIQVSAIKGQTYAQGGVIEEFANGGMVNGKSHAQGGEKFAVGGRVAELEGGEAVINKRSTAMFKGQLSAMNAAGGGVKFADGGLMNMPSFAQSQFNATNQQNMMGAMNQGSRVVVVEADITNSQNTVGVIEAEATF